MLGSTFVGYNFGVAGPFWFAAGYVPQVPARFSTRGSNTPHPPKERKEL